MFLLLTLDNFFVVLVLLMLLTEYASLITRKGQLEASLQQGDLLFRKNLSKISMDCMKIFRELLLTTLVKRESTKIICGIRRKKCQRDSFPQE